LDVGISIRALQLLITLKKPAGKCIWDFLETRLTVFARHLSIISFLLM